ncbi:MAG: ThuA domain-containing protein [Betaproteobacteria bacterium AqS2]|uniref:ThuA domain-containing protein n=1 Tax=Candidatus Amphirhobacter heronislandensis TaxID=1732024 RepID=A0A930UEC0_9GAMM|nr:ThuA domain-containing protein [Betaproteobacteria bacterium AqS2]
MSTSPVKALVWGENFHEQENKLVREVYPDGMHACIAAALAEDPGIEAATATLQEPEHGLTAEALAAHDVLLWWGHAKHGEVADEVVERVAASVWAGMGLIVLHSGHFAKIFKRLLGTPCNLSWREAGEKERVWTVNPRHPIAAGLPPSFVLPQEEMYGEPFGIPEPLETVFVSWFEGGEVFRSGVTFRRGAGSIFYFQPGHEVYPTYHDPHVRQVLRNAVRWAANPQPRIEKVTDAPNVPAASAPEPLTERGPKLHAAGEEGFK